MTVADIWIRDLSGTKALVADADEWTPRGWSVTTEPVDGDFVWMSHPDIAVPGNPIAWGARDYWMGRDWAPSAPPPPVDPTRDPALVDVPAKPPAASAPVKSTSAAPSAAKTKE